MATVAELHLCAQALNICLQRGDTFAFSFSLTDSETEAPIDITGYSFLLTVDTLENPPDATTNLFSLTGVLTNPTGGVVQFSLSALQADQAPDTYYYDVQMVDGVGGKRTVAKGEFLIEQDITKA